MKRKKRLFQKLSKVIVQIPFLYCIYIFQSGPNTQHQKERHGIYIINRLVK